jgi:hypothetical protein
MSFDIRAGRSQARSVFRSSSARSSATIVRPSCRLHTLYLRPSGRPLPHAPRKPTCPFRRAFSAIPEASQVHHPAPRVGGAPPRNPKKLARRRCRDKMPLGMLRSDVAWPSERRWRRSAPAHSHASVTSLTRIRSPRPFGDGISFSSQPSVDARTTRGTGASSPGSSDGAILRCGRSVTRSSIEPPRPSTIPTTSPR